MRKMHSWISTAVSPCACHLMQCPKNPQASLGSHSSTAGNRETALITGAVQKQKQKPLKVSTQGSSADTCWAGADKGFPTSVT